MAKISKLNKHLLLTTSLAAIFAYSQAFAQEMGGSTAPAGGAATGTESPTPAATPAPTNTETPEAPTPNPSTAPIAAGLDKDAQPKDYYSASGEGKTLPERVMRVRLPLRIATAEKGFDGAGNKVDNGVKLSAVGTALVAEYGLNDRLSLQFVMPMVAKNSVGLDARQFRKSKAYQDKYNQFVAALTKTLEAGGICSGITQCGNLIKSDYRLTTDFPVTLPNGEKIIVKSGVVASEAIDSVVINGAKPESGKTGIGDIEVGALYAAGIDAPVFFSVGLGLRIPTGSFKDVPQAQRGTGRGTLDLGLRTNLDYTPYQGVFLSWQNQGEFMLMKGKKKKSSIVDSNSLNSADPTTAEAVAAGSDGKDNEQEFKRQGLRNIGFLKASWGLGNVTQALKVLNLSTAWRYDFDMPSYLDGKLQDQGAHPQSQALGMAIGFDGLAYRIPVQLDLDYEIPLAGKNRTLSAQIFTATVKGFYKF